MAAPGKAHGSNVNEQLKAVLGWLPSNLTTVGAVAATVIFLVVVLGEARGNVDPAKAIISDAGPVSVALAIMVIFGPVLLAGACLIWAITALLKWRGGEEGPIQFGAGLLAMAVMLLCFVPMIPAAVFAMGASAILAYLALHGDDGVSDSVLRRSLLLTGILLVAIVVFWVPIRWLPNEVITPNSGKAFRATVLTDDQTNLVVLQGKSGVVVTYRDASIKSRQICETTDNIHLMSLWYYLVYQPHAKYARCPKDRSGISDCRACGRRVNKRGLHSRCSRRPSGRGGPSPPKLDEKGLGSGDKRDRDRLRVFLIAAGADGHEDALGGRGAEQARDQCDRLVRHRARMSDARRVARRPRQILRLEGAEKAKNVERVPVADTIHRANPLGDFVGLGHEQRTRSRDPHLDCSIVRWVEGPDHRTLAVDGSSLEPFRAARGTLAVWAEARAAASGTG